MKKAAKHYFILSTILFLAFAFGTKIIAQGLEGNYPSISGVEKPTSTATPLVLYLKYIYNLAITLAGIVLFISLIRGGVLYFSSGGNPTRMKNAKERIQNALLGILLVFSSYLILNTINPELVIFPVFNIQPITPVSVTAPDLSVNTVMINFKEIPIGTLLTSEFSVSSFIATSSPPEVCAPTSSPTGSSGILPPTTTACIYSTFEGALHGERLKRIHEVASTTLPVVDELATLSLEFLNVMKDFQKEIEKLYTDAELCDCINCNCVGCGTPKPGPCDPCPPCTGDPCPKRSEMNDLRENVLPSFYQNDDDPIPCRKFIIEYLAGAFNAFLDSNQLVKNDDYQDQSYWYSQEADDLRQKIENCIASGEITQDEYDYIETIIWNSDWSMASVENKGTISPETDPPERDVQTNLHHLKAIIEAIEEGRKYIEPYTPDVDSFSGTGTYRYSGHLTFVPRAQLVDFLGTTQYETEQIIGSEGFLPPGQSPESTLKVKIERYQLSNLANNIYVKPVGGDPAIFYAYSVPEIETFFPPITEKKNNVVYAQTPTGTPTSTENLYNPPSICSRVVEIPIGLTIDQGLELSSEIYAELYNIWEKGHFIINELKNQEELATSTIDLAKQLIDLTDETNCLNDCSAVVCKPGCLDIALPDNKSGHICLPICGGDDPCPIIDIRSVFLQTKINLSLIEQHYQQILKAKESIHKSFCKLDSGEDENGDICYIDSDFCCPDKNGNCRDSSNDLEVDKIEERKYTLKEKLIEIQKLLNRCREMVNKDKYKFRGQSAYEILLKQLIDMGLAQNQELNNIRYFDKLDLHNCWVRGFAEDIVAQAQEFGAELLNCKVAQGEVAEYLYKAIDPKNPELCSPDPLLDCDYFHPTATQRYFTDPARRQGRLPLSCYCYDEDIREKHYQSKWFPKMLKGNSLVPANNITSNLFCCVEPKEQAK